MDIPALKRQLKLPDVAAEQITVSARRLNLAKAAAIYKEFGCLVVRGLMSAYLPALARDIETVAQEAIAQLPQARQVTEGWVTPNGTLFLPAPKHYARDKQIMVLGINYHRSGAFFQTALDTKTLDLVEAILGPNLELFGNGQSLYKEPVGGHPKKLHQDAAYFEHRYEGPLAILNYVVPTDLKNGALHVIPGSHRLGVVKHVDTFSHLGLSEEQWPWEIATPIIGGPGDSIFFHVNTIHGSKENYSDRPRPVFINRYRRVDDYVVIGATTTANRAVAEQREKEQKKPANQLGLVVRGFRPFVA